MLVQSNQGVNFINVQCTAFIREGPKSAKKESKVVNLYLCFWDLLVPTYNVDEIDIWRCFFFGLFVNDLMLYWNAI